jgi:pyruvate/2-oxoglutarate dehydrogenase complex dihydrolipoamide dehydrogenase (E3) component
MLPSHDDNDRRLLENVRPAAWPNPTPAPRYNLVVIGAGTAGLVSAAGAAGLGAKVALIERHRLGGDCLNFGCVPSKALLRCARAAVDAKNAHHFGVKVSGGVAVDFAAVMERMRRLRADLSPHDSAQRFRDLGVDVFFGDARFAGPDTLSVGTHMLRFRRAIIATGSRPRSPEIAGLGEASYLTNETVFSLSQLPRRLAVLGAGPIGCELAQAFVRFGSQVTLLGNHEQVLPREDADAAAIVQRSLEADGVRVSLKSKLLHVESNEHEKVLHVEQSDTRTTIGVDALLVATGRQPNVEGLALDVAGVAFDRDGVTVNDRLQTTNGRIFAAGDVCSRYKFTHAADALARIALRNALFLGRAKASALVIPWCTYTDPELAHVGLSEREARERGIRVQVFRQEFAHVDRAVIDGDSGGFVKVLTAPGSDRILGATILSRHAGDLIGEITLARTAGLSLRMLAETIHPYPTHAEALKKVGDAYQRTRLTPFVAWLFRKWLAWRR